MPANLFRYLAAGALVATAAFGFNGQDDMLSAAATHFLNSLTPEQAAQVRFDFKDDERLNWHFIPKERKGLIIGDMTPPQKHLASALLAAALSQRGYIKAKSIMSLEDILRIMEKDDGKRRNPEKYHYSIFGTPSPTGTWGLRVEGHHLSLNFTIVNNKVNASPNFYGTNPAEVREGPRKGLRVLAAEEDLARSLVQSLSADQKQTAIVAKEAYKDILTMASRKAAIEGQPSGLSATKMNPKQREMLQAVIAEYVNNVPPAVAQTRQALVKKAGNNILFAWAGVEERGGPHYYRIQTPDFLIEYDNTQNGANHVHSVWREFHGDWGADLLGDHLKNGPGHTSASR